ncbi:hypothetical protein B0O80DRAFT_494118 [Mortierella sp. GBAus27b]|nr:hypothetical protein B0O80DRAFT_494118 [Mortierella sp. GBAus27b]
MDGTEQEIPNPQHIQTPKARGTLENPRQKAYLGGAPLDLHYRIRDPFSIPIQGETISTPNLVLRATRRLLNSVFEIVGAIPKTARFSGLADYQHIVDPREEVLKIKNDLVNMDYESLISVKIDNTTPAEDIATLQLLPPPIIGKSIVPMPFKYKARHSEEKKGGKPGRKPKRKSGVQRPPGALETTVNVGSEDSGNDDVYE